MARLARLYAPDTPQLVQARLARPLAAAHEATPAATLDQIQSWLNAELSRRPVALHGWALLLDRIILLATPAEPDALPRVIQGLGRSMASRMVHGRVFHERYRSTLVDDAWVNPSLVWLETLPVSDGLVDSPTRWPWSSAQEHVGLRMDTGLLTDHPAYWGLGNTPFARQARYQGLLQMGTDTNSAANIMKAIQGQWALGDSAFLERLAQRGSRRAAPAPRGRPRKSAGDNAVTN